MQFPDLQTIKLKWQFLRGYFDGDGSVFTIKNINSVMPRCSITSNSVKMLEHIKNFCNIKCYAGKNELVWHGLKALEFLNKLYNNTQLYLERKYNKYIFFKDWFPRCSYTLDTFKYIRTIPDAYAPIIRNKSYNLFIIKKIKKEDGIYHYDTCLKIEPKQGHKLKLSYLQKLTKLGYELINNNEIIDEKFSGTIIAKLRKIDKNAERIELPVKLLKLIPIE